MNEKERLKNAIETIKSLKEELRPFVNAAICFYVEQENILCKATGRFSSGNVPGDVKGVQFQWEIDEDSGDSLSIQWDEYWRYGGHDGGVFTLSWDFILDEEVRKQYAVDIAEKSAIAIKKREEQTLADKRKQLEKIKSELEQMENKTCGSVE